MQTQNSRNLGQAVLGISARSDLEIKFSERVRLLSLARRRRGCRAQTVRQTDRQSRTLHRTEGRTAPVHSVGHKMTGDDEVVETTAHEKSGVKITPLQKSKKKNSGEYRDLWCESCRWRGPRRYRNPCILQAQLAGDQVLVDILKR